MNLDTLKLYKGLEERIETELLRLDILKTELNHQLTLLDAEHMALIKERISIQNSLIKQLYNYRFELAKIVEKIGKEFDDFTAKVFAYHIIGNYSRKATAEKIGISVGTVKNIKTKIVKYLNSVETPIF